MYPMHRNRTSYDQEIEYARSCNTITVPLCHAPAPDIMRSVVVTTGSNESEDLHKLTILPFHALFLPCTDIETE